MVSNLDKFSTHVFQMVLEMARLYFGQTLASPCGSFSFLHAFYSFRSWGVSVKIV